MSLRQEIDAVCERNGGELTAVLLYEAAERNPASALHKHVFRHGKEQAIYLHRLQVCSDLIRKYTVVYREGSDDQKPVRGRKYINTSIDNSGGPAVYKAVSDVANDEFLRQLDLRRMERDWQAMKHRYGDRKEFYALIAADIEEAS